MLYFYKILSILRRKMGLFLLGNFFLVVGLRPRPKLPSPWASPDHSKLSIPF